MMLNLYTYLPEETVIGVKAGNGLVSTMPYKTVIAKSGFGYFADNGFKATTAEPVSIISGHISSETRLQEKTSEYPNVGVPRFFLSCVLRENQSSFKTAKKAF